jgi:hypothetical protein
MASADGKGQYVFTRSAFDSWDTTTVKRGAKRQPVAEGMFAESLKAGSLVRGMRVVGMRRGMVNGRGYVSVKTTDGVWTEPLFYGSRVAGTKRRTDFLAGPVNSGRGVKAERPAWNEGDTPTDRNARRIDALTYA